MPSHNAPLPGLPDKHRSLSAPSLPFPLKKTVLLTGIFLIAGLFPGPGNTTTINNGNLTSTFGDGSANLICKTTAPSPAKATTTSASAPAAAASPSPTVPTAP